MRYAQRRRPDGPALSFQGVVVVSFTVRMNVVLVACLLLATPVQAREVEDPWQGVNRKIFAFNEGFDRYLLKPVARGYKKVTPTVVDNSISRFFANLADLRSSVHGVLQWEWGNAGNNMGRFVVNSTVGIAGLFDAATDLGLRKTNEDMGLTFAQWGIGEGPYLVLPFLGSSTVRDAVGLIPDDWLRARHYIDHDPTRFSVTAVYVVDLRADLLDVERAISGDRYIFLRDFYLNSRRLAAGEAPPEDDFGSELPAGDWDDSGDDGW